MAKKLPRKTKNINRKDLKKETNCQRLTRSLPIFQKRTERTVFSERSYGLCQSAVSNTPGSGLALNNFRLSISGYRFTFVICHDQGRRKNYPNSLHAILLTALRGLHCCNSFIVRFKAHASETSEGFTASLQVWRKAPLLALAPRG